METSSAHLSGQIETVAELRMLYRAAEARAARLRLLSAAGRELALAETGSIAQVLQTCADRLAHFLGQAQAKIASTGPGLIIPDPDRSKGTPRAPLMWVQIEGLSDIADIADAEDREAVRLLLELMGATASRIEREIERARLTTALREREQRLEYVIGRLFTAQEDERRRVSHELHDGVAQTATALLRLVEGGTASTQEPVSAPERVRLAQIARDLVQEIRAIIGGLRPTLLDDLGLREALRNLTEDLEKDGYSVDFDIRTRRDTWPSHVEIALFRVAQEAISNIRKHAGGPCHVTLSLIDDEPSSAILRISDTGCGTGTVPAPPDGQVEGMHVGREIIHERMLAIGGSLSWEAGAQGVTVTARLPQLM